MADLSFPGASWCRNVAVNVSLKAAECWVCRERLSKMFWSAGLSAGVLLTHALLSHSVLQTALSFVK